MEINQWFEIKVKMDVMQDDGMTKSVPFRYIVDALNFTEAEARVIEEVKPYTSGSLDVEVEKKVRISEIFPDASEQADKWYKAKLMFITIDEKTQTEKETPANILVQAGTFDGALERLRKGMSGSLMDYRVAKLEETQIMDVFVYRTKDEKAVD